MKNLQWITKNNNEKKLNTWEIRSALIEKK